MTGGPPVAHILIDIFLTVLPVFLVIAIGYASARTGYLSPTIADPLNAFTVKLAVPVLLFRALYRLDLSTAFHPPLLLSFYIGAFTSFAIGILLARLVWKRRPGEAVAVGFCALFSNLVLLSVPIIQRAFGEEALTPVFGVIALHAPTLYIVGSIVMELSRRDGRPIRETLRSAFGSIVTNTLMIGIVTGAIFNLAGIHLPEPVMAAVDMLSAAAIPAALVGIGASLTRYQMKSELSESLAVSALSLGLHPTITFVLAHWVFGLAPEYVRVAVILAAMPSGMNVYIFAAMYDRAVALAASVVLVATTLSIATITIWLFILRAVLPG